MPSINDESAFPTLTDEELRLIRPLGKVEDLADGQAAFRAGDADIDLFVIESGLLDIHNPTDSNRVIVTHEPGTFSGDIDLITRRPVIVTGVARGPTRVLRVPGNCLRELLNRVPRFGEKLMIAFTKRRELLSNSGIIGLRVVGPGRCKDTNVVREFLYKNFVPFTWYDPETPEGKAVLIALGSPRKSPVIELGGGRVLINPSLHELAKAAGVWRACPDRDVDFAIIGAGPAGIAAAVYAASEGLSTIVLDRLGPGGQVGGSSKIENFMGFPAGLSGTDLATRGVLQMLRFGAMMAAPVSVDRLDPAKAPGGAHTLHLDCGATVRSPVVLIATGVRWRKLEAEGADRFEGAGVHYVCTRVEAHLYDAGNVAVVGGGNSAGQAAVFLAECNPARRVNLLVRHHFGPGMSEYLSTRIRGTPNIIVHEGAEIARVIGNRRVELLELKPNGSGKVETLPCSAAFIFIGADPLATWLPDSIARDKLGYLLTGTDVVRSGGWPRTDRDPCPLETCLPGVLAAGDIRAGSTKRVGFAVGDGSLAVTCAHRLRSMIV
ncbi:MAG: trxB [Phycisphaerales bacterium]|nr:trxB [Phycisphaerales bacterium]MDB5302493.1 trxB [Phycisphaerales bacterium]